MALLMLAFGSQLFDLWVLVFLLVIAAMALAYNRAFWFADS